MKAGRAPVAVAVVSWNTRALLIRCLRSLEPDVEAGRARVWVVDNDSSDGSSEAVAEHAPWATVLAPGSNAGFGRAVNLVARETESDWLLAANADVELEPGALEALVAVGGDQRVGAVAPRLLLPGGATQHSVHPLPTLPFTLAFNLGIHRLVPALAERWCIEGSWDAERSRAVPWAIGACLLLRRTAFDAVGGFDERQWLYAEDLDLGWRLRRAGLITRYEPRSRVLHASGAAATQAFGEDRTAVFMRATYEMMFRRRGAWRTRATAAVNALGALGRLVWLTPLALVAPRFRPYRDTCRMWLKAHREGLLRATESDLR